jgi:hypothetical protein
MKYADAWEELKKWLENRVAKGDIYDDNYHGDTLQVMQELEEKHE